MGIVFPFLKLLLVVIGYLKLLVVIGYMWDVCYENAIKITLLLKIYI